MRTHLNTKALSRVLIVVAVAALALTASACGGGKNSNSAGATGSTGSTGSTGATGATVSADQWATGVCSAFTTWKTSLHEARATITSGSVTEATLNDAANQAKDANQKLVQSLQGLGKPSTADGQKAQENLKDLETSLSFSMNKIKDTVHSKPSSMAELAAAVTTVKQAEATMVAALQTAVKNLKKFDPSGELETAFNDAPSCAPYF